MLGRISAIAAAVAGSFALAGSANAANQMDLVVGPGYIQGVPPAISPGVPGIYFSVPPLAAGSTLDFVVTFEGLILNKGHIVIDGDMDTRFWNPVSGNNPPYEDFDDFVGLSCYIEYGGCIRMTSPNSAAGRIYIPEAINNPCGVGTPIGTICSREFIPAYVTGGFFFNYDGSGTVPSAMISFTATAVPEPATWAMMIAGFGLAGAALRRSRTTLAA